MLPSNYMLRAIKPLNSQQYDAAREAAIARIKQRIGERPTRKQFRREYGSVFTLLDILALIVFVAALAISSAHIMAHMGRIAQMSYPAQQAGITIDLHTWATIHQAAAIFLAEASAVLFATLHSMGAAQRRSRGRIIRYVSVPGVLALLAAAFVLTANLSSGVDLLTALLPPVMTLGIALRLEALAVALLHRSQEVDKRYLEAVQIYELASADPEQHPEFMKTFRQEIWAALMRIQSNRQFIDADRGVKWAAVERELERERAFETPPGNISGVSEISFAQEMLPEGNLQEILESLGNSGNFGNQEIRLPPAEQKVIDFINSNPEAREWKNKDIAEHLGVSPGTVSKAFSKVSDGR